MTVCIPEIADYAFSAPVRVQAIKIEPRTFTRSKEQCWKECSHTLGQHGGMIANTKRNLAYIRAKHQTKQCWHISLYFATVNRRRRALDSPKSLRTSLRNHSTPCDRLERLAKDVKVTWPSAPFLKSVKRSLPKKVTSLLYAHVFTRIRPRLFGGLSIVAGTLVELVLRCLTSRQDSHVPQPINQGCAVAAAHETAN